MSISIGLIMGDGAADTSSLGRALNLALEVIERRRIDSFEKQVPMLNVVFLVPGSLSQPAHSGLRIIRFSKARQALLVHIGVEQSNLNGDNPLALVFDWLRAAVDEAEPLFEARGVAFSRTDHLKFLEDIQGEKA